jgi:ribosomal protein S4
MEMNARTMQGRIARVPARDELELNLNEQLIVEYYSR